MTFPSAQRRRLRRREDARRAIIDAAEEILAEDGYGGFSIRRLTEHCGYTAPTIYHHFGDKNGLLDAVMEERFQALLKLLRRIPERDDPVDTIRARAQAFARFGTRNPNHYRLLTLEREADASPLEAMEKARAFLERPWRELETAGRLLVSDIQVAQRAAFALLHGMIAIHNTRPDLPWSRNLFDESLDALLRGLAAPLGGSR